MKKTRVAVLGYGALGKYLVKELATREDEYTVVHVWNRTESKVTEDPLVASKLIKHVGDLKPGQVDLVVEVCHPAIVQEYGQWILGFAALFVGSPTALAQVKLLPTLHPCYVPAGALWGGQDIAKMAARGNLAAVTITMTKNVHHLGGLCGQAKEALEQYKADTSDSTPRVLFRGSVRDVCPLAPNNVNTMACAAIVGLGFDATTACLIADKTLEAHVVAVTVLGTNGFRVESVRTNPAAKGSVTGSATFASFVSSLWAAHGKNDGIHLV